MKMTPPRSPLPDEGHRSVLAAPSSEEFTPGPPANITDILDVGVLDRVLGYLDIRSLTSCVAVHNGPLSVAARCHQNWKWYILQNFGVYYEDYVRGLFEASGLRRTCGGGLAREPGLQDEVWRLLFIYVKQVLRNVDGGIGEPNKGCVVRRFPGVCKNEKSSARNTDGAERGFGDEERGSRRRAKQYARGCVELSDSGRFFYWENGRELKLVEVLTGETKAVIPFAAQEPMRQRFHRVATCGDHLFICLNDRIVYYDFRDLSRPPREVPAAPNMNDRKGRPVELLLHANRLALLESHRCIVWALEKKRAHLKRDEHDDLEVRYLTTVAPPKEMQEAILQNRRSFRGGEGGVPVFREVVAEPPPAAAGGAPRPAAAFLRAVPAAGGAGAGGPPAAFEDPRQMDRLLHRFAQRQGVRNQDNIIDRVRGRNLLLVAGAVARFEDGQVPPANAGANFDAENDFMRDDNRGNFFAMVDPRDFLEHWVPRLHQRPPPAANDAANAAMAQLLQGAGARGRRGPPPLHMAEALAAAVGAGLHAGAALWEGVEEGAADAAAAAQGLQIAGPDVDGNDEAPEAFFAEVLELPGGIDDGLRPPAQDDREGDPAREGDPVQDPLPAAPPPPPARFRPENATTKHLAFEIQWIGSQMLTWVRGSIYPLEIYELETGRKAAELHQSTLVPAKWVQADVARVTWLGADDTDYFLIGALDECGIVSLWDSSYNLLVRFNGCSGFGGAQPLDFVLTQDWVCVVDDELILHFYKCWFHPTRENDCIDCKRENGEEKAAMVKLERTMGEFTGRLGGPFSAFGLQEDDGRGAGLALVGGDEGAGAAGRRDVTAVAPPGDRSRSCETITTRASSSEGEGASSVGGRDGSSKPAEVLERAAAVLQQFLHRKRGKKGDTKKERPAPKQKMYCIACSQRFDPPRNSEGFNGGLGRFLRRVGPRGSMKSADVDKTSGILYASDTGRSFAIDAAAAPCDEDSLLHLDSGSASRRIGSFSPVAGASTALPLLQEPRMTTVPKQGRLTSTPGDLLAVGRYEQRRSAQIAPAVYDPLPCERGYLTVEGYYNVHLVDRHDLINDVWENTPPTLLGEPLDEQGASNGLDLEDHLFSGINSRDQQEQKAAGEAAWRIHPAWGEGESGQEGTYADIGAAAQGGATSSSTRERGDEGTRKRDPQDERSASNSSYVSARTEGDPEPEDDLSFSSATEQPAQLDGGTVGRRESDSDTTANDRASDRSTRGPGEELPAASETLVPDADLPEPGPGPAEADTGLPKSAATCSALRPQEQEQGATTESVPTVSIVAAPLATSNPPQEQQTVVFEDFLWPYSEKSVPGQKEPVVPSSSAPGFSQQCSIICPNDKHESRTSDDFLVRKVDSFQAPDIDSYFAAYRNSLNICTYHKSGQESLLIFHSATLRRQLWFPPAKHSKFDEWLALQVLENGDVLVHDFRPWSLSFDEWLALMRPAAITDRQTDTVTNEGHGGFAEAEKGPMARKRIAGLTRVQRWNDSESVDQEAMQRSS